MKSTKRKATTTEKLLQIETTCAVLIARLVALAVFSSSVFAASDETGVDLDAPPQTKNSISDSLSFGSSVSLQYESKNNFNLESSNAEDLEILQPTIEFALEYRPNENLFGFVNFELRDEFEITGEGKNRERPTELFLDEAYLTISNAKNSNTIQIGRQEFKDKREWYYDDQLDALRFYFSAFNSDIEASISRDEIIGRDIINHDEVDRVNNLIVSAEYEPSKKNTLTGFLVARDDRSKDDEDPVIIGLRSQGELTDNFVYWADIALVGGSDEGEKISGSGFDIGTTYKFDSAYTPYVTVGYALGSGDPDSEDDKDSAFRQTGLQDNSAKLGGVTRLQYYGELLDPELRNLKIITAGFGVRLTKKSSIDILYHRYQQDSPSDKLRSQLDRDPDGVSTDLGSEIDLVAGFIGKNGINLELAFGYFIPGDAFPNMDNATFAKIEAKYDF